MPRSLTTSCTGRCVADDELQRLGVDELSYLPCVRSAPGKRICPARRWETDVLAWCRHAHVEMVTLSGGETAATGRLGHWSWRAPASCRRTPVGSPALASPMPWSRAVGPAGGVTTALTWSDELPLLDSASSAPAMPHTASSATTIAAAQLGRRRTVRSDRSAGTGWAGARRHGSTAVCAVVVGDERSGVDPEDVRDAANVPAGVEVAAAVLEVVRFDAADERGADAGGGADVVDAHASVLARLRENAADAHVGHGEVPPSRLRLERAKVSRRGPTAPL